MLLRFKERKKYSPPWPCTKERKTDLSTVVQVWIETNRAPSSGSEVQERRGIWIVQRHEAVKLKKAPGVGCTFGARYHYLAFKEISSKSRIYGAIDSRTSHHFGLHRHVPTHQEASLSRLQPALSQGEVDLLDYASRFGIDLIVRCS